MSWASAPWGVASFFRSKSLRGLPTCFSHSSDGSLELVLCPAKLPLLWLLVSLTQNLAFKSLRKLSAVTEEKYNMEKNLLLQSWLLSGHPNTDLFPWILLQAAFNFDHRPLHDHVSGSLALYGRILPIKCYIFKLGVPSWKRKEFFKRFHIFCLMMNSS